MSQVLRISAKKLGRLAMPDFCPRCFWVLNHMNGDSPYSVFPRIFNDIDGYTKRVVHGHFDENGAAPAWLDSLGKLTGYLNPPKSAKFQMPLGDNILLTGEADGIYIRDTGKLAIVDYKTAFYQGADDPLYPVYRIQLNTYAMLAEYTQMGKVDGLALIYCQPCCSDLSARLPANRRDDGFALGFRCEVLPVPIKSSEVKDLADTAYGIYSQSTVPNGRSGCRDCAQVDEMIAAIGRINSSRAAYAMIGA